MRQIKFRGLRTDGKGWVYGDLIQYSSRETKILVPFYRDWDILEAGYDVIPESVGQFITNNGNQDFYIGDVVINPKGRKHTVVIWDNLPCLHYSEKGRDFYSPMTNGFLANKKVIGSIHTTHDKGKDKQ